MSELLTQLYTWLLMHYGTRADIRICFVGPMLNVYVNSGTPYLELHETQLRAWLEREDHRPPVTPARKGLIVCALAIALAAEEQKLRAVKPPGFKPLCVELHRVRTALMLGDAVTTREPSVRDLAALTQQQLRISHSEWATTIHLGYEGPL